GSAERARRVAALARLLRAVRAVRQRQFDAAAGRTVAQWRAEWTQLLCDFTATTPATAWLSAQVHAALDEFVAQSGDWPGLLTLGAVRRALADRFDMPVRGDRPITGAVTVCALQPMRSVPFAVIALIGMDDGAFPAVAAPRAWDPFAVQRPGELDGRLVQRHLLLETLLSARRQLLVLFDGHGIQPEDRRPAAVPIEELVDVLTRLSGRDRTAWVTDTTLQPWDPGAFSGPRPPFDQAHADAATALLAAARADPPPGPLGLAATVAALCPPEDVPPTSVGVQELALGLAEPQGLFLDQRLHIRLPRDREPLADREPLELGHLDGWQVRELLLADRGLRAGEPPAAVAARVTRRLAAEGRLPMAAGGAVLVADYVAELCEVLALLARGQGAPIDPPLIAVDIDVSAAGRPQRLRVQGTPPAVQAWQGQWLLQWIVANVEPKPKHELAAWIHLLAARAAGLPAIGARVVGGRAKAGSKGALAEATLACDLPPAQALALLGDYGRIWLAARHRPLPLFARTSSCLASAVAEGATGREMAKKIAVPWFGNENSAGECEDRHIAAFFGHYDAPADVADPRTDGLRDLAQRVWLPIATARGAGEALAKAWQGPQEGLS
ncbi:MAG: exodeoxyribonuclease V subunit gamma, partial [Deltaproteobacteria bacterium]|nr:exodeoxyribonuclease V subunit gamma [Deltaproteobacteria bacterium]